MEIQFHHIEPHYLLKNYIPKMWLFESSGKIATEDLKLVVPNGNLKLTVSFQNGIVAEINGKPFSSKSGQITLTGLVDVPVILDVDEDIPTRTLGVEFNPRGAYRFFRLPLNSIQNQIHSIEDLWGNLGTGLVRAIQYGQTVSEKIHLLQQFLIQQLGLHDEDPIFEYCVESIFASKGKIPVKELERKTGYSSRWLNMKFQHKLGVSPKNLASIVRFKQYYQAWINGDEKHFFKNDYYELYYDQSHFIKDFKRFTGLPPTQFERSVNDFGERYYRD